MTTEEHVDGLFVIVEGADGSGKSAAVDHLVSRLQRDGRPVHRIDRGNPSGPPEYANLIKATDTIFRSSHKLGTSWDLLTLAAAAQYTAILHGQVAPAVRAGTIVIAESWFTKTWIRLAIEATIHLGLDDDQQQSFRAWQRALIPATTRQVRPWELTIVVEATEADRTRWYTAGPRTEPVYDQAGRTSRDPAEFGRFTEQIATALRELAQQHHWPIVGNGCHRTPDDVAADLLTLINAARTSSTTA